MSNKLTPIAVLAMALHAAGAHAADPDMFSFSGFGTLGVVHSSERNADFTSNFFKAGGAGFSSHWGADVDSLIAGQVTANFTSQFSAIVQVVADRSYDTTWTPGVEWANIKYQVTPDLSVRLGRTVLPVFMVSDSRLIGYSNPWVRPPLEVYDLVPITSNDGVDASYRMQMGAATNTVQIIAGRSNSKFPAGGGLGIGTAQARGVFAVTDTFEHGDLTLRVDYFRGRFSIPEFGPALFDVFRQFGPEGVAIADRYEIKGRSVSFVGLGASYDPGPWFLMGEWGHTNTRSILGTRTGWYATGGYRFGKVTPFVTYGRVTADSQTSVAGLTVSALPPALAGPATALNAGLDTLVNSKSVQNTISVGGRWDFMKSAALIVQLDHSRHGAGSAGTLINLQPEFVRGGTVTVFSAAVSFVF